MDDECGRAINRMLGGGVNRCLFCWFVKPTWPAEPVRARFSCDIANSKMCVFSPLPPSLPPRLSILPVQCGGTAKITRSRHPAVIVAPAPAPAPGGLTETQQGSGGVAAAAVAAAAGTADGDGGSRRANDWDCPNPDCDNVCFSFRTSCNRCGTGKDGTPPPEDFRLRQGGGGGKGRGLDGEPVVATLHRPRLQLG